MRAFIYLALVGAACLLLLLPLRGALVPPPAWAMSPQAVMAGVGLYSQTLLPGESRTYVMEMSGHSRLKIRFKGSSSSLGLRVEDSEGIKVGAVGSEGSAKGQDRRLGVVNPAATAKTLYLTVYRDGSESPYKRVLSRLNSAPQSVPSRRAYWRWAEAPGPTPLN